MLVRVSKLFSVAALSTVFCLSVWSQAAGPTGQAQSAGQAAGQPEKKVKDRGEYDLYNSVTTEKDPQKRLEFLNQWMQKYPETDYKKERLLFYLSTYQQLNQPQKIIDTANQILAMDPKDFTSLFWLATLTIPPANASDTSPATLDRGEKAARGMLDNLNDTFAESKKPANMDAAGWAKAKTDMETLAHKTLGWIAMVRKNNDVAEQELTKALQTNPNDSFAAYWLGQAYYQDKKFPQGLYLYALRGVV